MITAIAKRMIYAHQLQHAQRIKSGTSFMSNPDLDVVCVVSSHRGRRGPFKPRAKKLSSLWRLPSTPRCNNLSGSFSMQTTRYSEDNLRSLPRICRRSWPTLQRQPLRRPPLHCPAIPNHRLQ